MTEKTVRCPATLTEVDFDCKANLSLVYRTDAPPLLSVIDALTKSFCHPRNNYGCPAVENRMEKGMAAVKIRAKGRLASLFGKTNSEICIASRLEVSCHKQ